MKLDLQFVSSLLEDLCCDTIVVFVFQDVNVAESGLSGIDSRAHGTISRLFEKGFFRGGQEETLLVPLESKQNPGKLLLKGIGNHTTYTNGHFLKIISEVIDTLEGIHVHDIATRLPLKEEPRDEYLGFVETVCIHLVDGFLSKHANDDCEIKIMISLDDMFFDRIEKIISNLKGHFNAKLDYTIIFDRKNFSETIS